MQWSGHPYLLCEEIAESVREPLALARERGLLAHFDYEGLTPVARAEGQGVKSLAERLAMSGVRNTAAGSVSFLSRVNPSGPAECRLHLQLLSTARMLSADGEDQLQRSITHSVDPAVTSFAVVRALCEAMQGRFSYRSGAAGSVVDVEVPIPCLAPLRDMPSASAEGAQAWLVGDDPRIHGLLPRRLERLDWSVRLFETTAEVDAALAVRSHAASPALVVVSTGAGRKIWVSGLRQRVSPQTQLFYVADSTGAPTSGIAGVYIQRPPFSPRQLAHMTHMAQVSGLRPSGDTAPAPLSFRNRPRALVVEPSDVNAAIMFAELFAAGFEVVRIAHVGELRRAISQAAVDLAIVNTQAELPAGALAAIRDSLERSEAVLPHPVIGMSWPPQQGQPEGFDTVVGSAHELSDLLYRSGALSWMQFQS
jgi:hypothetical protein